MSRAARRLLGHRCTEPPMLCMTMSHIMRHEPLPRARPRGLSRRRGRRSRRRTSSTAWRGASASCTRRATSIRPGPPRTRSPPRCRRPSQCAACRSSRAAPALEVISGGHLGWPRVLSHLVSPSGRLWSSASSQGVRQLAAPRLHHAQVRHRVALVQRAAAQLEEADVVVQRVAPHLEAQVAGAIVAPLEGLGVALGRVDVEWLDELLAALACAREGGGGQRAALVR
mmetsp:Transcript_31133/g.91293  ORF Transcript_31133/g.91293 Transcript_31133/m.91293 type:complete len:227 (+) Transcript_31133:305-985(+)